MELTRIALRVSGFDQVSRQLQVQLGSRADVLKAGAQLHLLLERADAAGERGIFDAAQGLLDRPEMFELQIFGLAKLLASGDVTLPPGLAEQAWILISTGLPVVSGAEAMRRAAEWREWAGLTDGAGRLVARVMVRAWQLAARGEGRAHGGQ